jgi:hypothetical protein
MSAYLFIQEKRRTAERIDMVDTLGIGMHGTKRDLERILGRWARSAGIKLTFSEE